MTNSPTRNVRSIGLLLALVLVIAAIFFLRQKADETSAGSASSSSAAAETAATLQPGPTPAASDQAAAKASERAEEWQERKRREGVDATNLYADAFVLFQKLTDEEKNMIRKPGDEVDAEKAAALYAKLQPIMELLRQAAKADFCDWGTGEINFETSLPHMGKAHDLGKLALWAAGYRFPTDPTGAIDDLGVRARLGHHLSDTLIGLLVNATFEKSAHGLLRQHLGGADRATIEAATRFVNGSTLDADISRAMAGEMAGAESMGRKLIAATDEERARLLVGFNLPDAPTAEQQANAQKLITALRAPGAIESQLSFIQGVERQMPEAMALPEAEFQKWWKGVESSLTADRWLAKMVLPSLGGVQRTVQQLRVERTLFAAAADVLQNGPAQVGRYKDPATGAPLQYIAKPGGFELQSPYQVKGKPVTVAFQRPQ